MENKKGRRYQSLKQLSLNHLGRRLIKPEFIMSRSNLQHVTWSILLFFFVVPFCLAGEKNEKTFPIPVGTAEKAVVNWLETEGFRIHRTHINQHRTYIRAEKEDHHWHIEISPQSALASHIRAHFAGPEPADNIHDIYQPLWYQISQEVTSSNWPDQDNSQNRIPNQILRHARSVVCMRDQSNGKMTQVSGFFLHGKKGLILSTAHGLTDFQGLTIFLDNGQEIKGQVFSLDKKLDLSLILTESKSNDAILLTESRNFLNLGDQLYTIGCSANCSVKVKSGTINAPPKRANNQFLWQVQMEILPGDSGSPVFDEKGRLVAVVKGRHRVMKEVGFLIPMETVITFIKANIDYVR